MSQNERMEKLELLLAEGLDLCVRARSMDAMDRRAAALGVSINPERWQESGLFDKYVEKHNQSNPDQPIHTRSGTVHLWLQDQYDRDLADWEKRARDYLMANKHKSLDADLSQ